MAIVIPVAVFGLLSIVIGPTDNWSQTIGTTAMDDWYYLQARIRGGGWPRGHVPPRPLKNWLKVGLYRLCVRFHLSQNFQRSYCNARHKHWDGTLQRYHNNHNNGYCDVYGRLTDDAQAQTVCYFVWGGPTSLYRPPLTNRPKIIVPPPVCVPQPRLPLLDPPLMCLDHTNIYISTILS